MSQHVSQCFDGHAGLLNDAFQETGADHAGRVDRDGYVTGPV
jgi:hypothetical protein